MFGLSQAFYACCVKKIYKAVVVKMENDGIKTKPRDHLNAAIDQCGLFLSTSFMGCKIAACN